MEEPIRVLEAHKRVRNRFFPYAMSSLVRRQKDSSGTRVDRAASRCRHGR